MKTNILSTTLAASVLLALTVGCADSNSSSSGVSASFKMTGSSSNATVAKNEKPGFLSMLLNKAYALVPASIQDASGLNVTLSEAWVVVKEIQFKTEETAGAEDSSVEVEFTGPYVVDLLSNTPLVLDTQQIAEKPIRRIKMKFHKVESLPITAPAGLLNNSIYIAGTIGGNSFVFQLDDGTESQIFGPTSFQPSEGSELLVEIQVANIFKQINLSSVADGEIINASNRHAGANLCNSIDASANDIYTCVRKGLEKHGNFGVDTDHDDDLDASDSSVK